MRNNQAPGISGYLICSNVNSGCAVIVYKSQETEFDTVLILVPERTLPVVTRQLLFTGITRSRNKVIIFGSMPMIRQAVKTSVEPRSNLPAVLDGHRP